MEMLGKYINGNYTVTIFDDGTKIRETDDEVFKPEFPESMDCKITNQCDMGCPFCHENSVVDGEHGDILNAEFIDTIKPYTEMAIGGGNPLSHPQLVEFLQELREKKIIANMTVNQKHFLANQYMLQLLVKRKLIYGLGVSLTSVTDEMISCLKNFPNAVIHIINGVVNVEDLKLLYDKNFKVLVLGYKEFRRGIDFYSLEVENKKHLMYDSLPEIVNHFKVVSFDNLAIKQLDVKRLLSQEKWDEFYMGNDGQFTMYVDLVKKEFAVSSVSTDRYKLLSNIEDMFQIIKGENR